ncbi:transcription factor E2FB isoform X1 [Capsicum galapagoense]
MIPQQQQQQQQALKRQLQFSSIKPVCGDYHRFSNDPVHGSLQEPPGIVVMTPPLKRKSTATTYGQEVGDRNPVSGSANVNSPMQTPMSGKDVQKVLRTSKAKSASQAGNSNVGSPSGNDVTPAGPCRYDSSLGLLTKKFINLIKRAEDGMLDLNKAADTLQVQKRRIYDITNVLEGIGLIEKTLKNRIQWKGLDVSKPGEANESVASLQAEVEKLTIKEHKLDDQIREMQERLRDLSEDENNQRWLFVTEDDIKSLPCFQNETLIAIKAPHGTTLEVPDPDEAVDYPQRRYRIVLRSTMGPIDVYLVSQFEEKFEEVNAVEAPPSVPSTSDLNENATATLDTEENREVDIVTEEKENQRVCSDVGTSQDFMTGMMKIVPDVDNEADYWLLSDADVSITDMWKTESAIDWNELDVIQEDYSIANVSTPRAQTPPPSTAEVPSADNTTGC